MLELTYNFEYGDAARERGKDDGDVSGRYSKLQEQGRALLSTLATPWTDCQRRSHPRVVPDYSFLVLLACLCNPVLGAVACALHRRAKNLSMRGETRPADVLYLVVMALSLVSVGSTLVGVSLAAAYQLIQRYSLENIQRAKPDGDCFFREWDDLERKRLNLSRNDYCRRKKALKGRRGWRLPAFYTVINRTAALKGKEFLPSLSHNSTSNQTNGNN